MKKISHGGNIYKKAKEMGIREEDILDFSANISPLGLPEHIRKAMIEAIDGTINYPDPDCSRLKEAISKQDNVPESHITCGNGGADLLYRLAFGLHPKKVLLPAPAFVEYEEALSAAGAQMEYYLMRDDFVIKEDTEKELILRVLERAKETNTFVMADECFLEICQNESEYTVKPFIEKYENLIILKSFTKLYAIPGVRLGYILAGSEDVIAKVNRTGQAWSVSHIAQCAGVAALSDNVYKERVIETVAAELSYMKKEFFKLPVILYDGAANYLFFQTPGIADLDRRLESYGIMIRNCSNYVNLGKDYWRVAVKSHEENEKLIKALRMILKGEE